MIKTYTACQEGRSAVTLIRSCFLGDGGCFWDTGKPAWTLGVSTRGQRINKGAPASVLPRQMEVGGGEKELFVLSHIR